MDEDLMLSVIQSNPLELPDSIQVVLQSIESAKLTRARAEVADRLEVILNSVNTAVQRLRLANVVLAEEESDDEDDEVDEDAAQDLNKRRESARSSIEAFFLSNFDKTEYLNTVLHWLKDIDEDLAEAQRDEHNLADITPQWVEEMEEKIELSLLGVETSIRRLYQLCRQISTADGNKNETESKGKDGVWRWWRELKVNAKTVLKIQTLQPPSVEELLDDGALAAESTSNLDFMFKDMAKFLSCKKAMAMAFNFGRTGLQNMCAALEERTRETELLRKELQRLKAESAQTEPLRDVDTSGQLYISRLKTDLNSRNRNISQMKLQINGLEQDNTALLQEAETLRQAAVVFIPVKQPPPSVTPSPKASVASVASVVQYEEEMEEEEGEEESEPEPETQVSSDEEPAPPAEETKVVPHVSEVRVSLRSVTPEERPVTPEIKVPQPPAPKAIPVIAPPEKRNAMTQVPSQSSLLAGAERLLPSVTTVPGPVGSLEALPVRSSSSIGSFGADKEDVEAKPESPQPKMSKDPQPRRSPVFRAKTAPPPSFQTPSPLVQFLEEDLEHYMEDLMEEGGESIEKEMAARRHRLSVEAQRTNLKLMRQAAQSDVLPSKLYQMAKHTIKHSLNAAELRLSCLMRKYIAYKALMQVRHNLNVQLQCARECNDGLALSDTYTFLSNLEKYERTVMNRLSIRRAAAEEDRFMHLTRTTCLFRQIREDCGVHLILPYTSSCDSQGKPSLSISCHKLVVAPRPHSRSRRRLQRPPTAPARMLHQRSDDVHRVTFRALARPE
ncbi:uncharacterized protein LOC134079564 [Sardina pilchardus]|uniref:uncharacterized protein LOC134079564 n=1 Tax=Sardina pilchardus TaxID=27697 RepID=UPI002E0F8BF1